MLSRQIVKPEGYFSVLYSTRCKPSITEESKRAVEKSVETYLAWIKLQRESRK